MRPIISNSYFPVHYSATPFNRNSSYCCILNIERLSVLCKKTFQNTIVTGTVTKKILHHGTWSFLFCAASLDQVREQNKTGNSNSSRKINQGDYKLLAPKRTNICVNINTNLLTKTLPIARERGTGGGVGWVDRKRSILKHIFGA